MKVKKHLDKYNLRLSSFFILFLISLIAYSQTPEGFNYQSVVRDASGDVISNTTVGVQFKLHQTTATGTVVYTETHTPTTNSFGVFNVVVGQGTTTDDFSAIDWSSNSHFIEVSIDIAGGTTYVSMGTTQLLSVPYALQAKYVENGDNLGDHTATQNIQTGGNWISNDGGDEGISIKANGDVGIGEANPQTSLDVVDTAVIGNIAVGSQSTAQNASNSKDLGFTTSPWLYTTAIEATNERGSSSTLITLGSDGNFGLADEIHFITDGASQVDISNGLLNVSGNIKSSGNFEFDGILTTTSSENQIFGNYDNTSNLSNLSQNNVIIGTQAAENAQSGSNNVVIGYFSGYNLNGDSNVILGTGAGLSGTAFSQRLYIRDLVYGEFDNNLLQVKGELKVDENIATDGNIIIDEDGDDLRAAGAANNVEMISVIVNADGSLNSNVTNSSGITASLSGNIYTVNYSNHFSSIPAVTITCITTTSNTRGAQITSLAQGKVEYIVRSSAGNAKTDAATVLTIIGKR